MDINKQGGKMAKRDAQWLRVEQVFPPVFDADSKVLILGTAPSAKSRECGFFYGHPQNRFWKVLAGIAYAAVPQSNEEKRRFLLENHIAVYDVIESCEIIGSSDSTIRNVVPMDLTRILSVTGAIPIFGNGKKAFELYNKYQWDNTGIDMTLLPSTSPANAVWTLDKLEDAWGAALGVYI